MAEQEVVEEKSSKMKLIIIALVVLLLGGGAAYYFMFMGASEGGAPETAVSSEEQVAEKTVYLTLKKPIKVTFPADTGVRLLQVSISIAFLKDINVRNEFIMHEPMIRNNFLMIMGRQNPQDLKSSEGKQKLQALLLAEMQLMMEKVSVEANIQNVFFTSFVMQ